MILNYRLRRRRRRPLARLLARRRARGVHPPRGRRAILEDVLGDDPKLGGAKLRIDERELEARLNQALLGQRIRSRMGRNIDSSCGASIPIESARMREKLFIASYFER